jgi:hypothetical protein
LTGNVQHRLAGVIEGQLRRIARAQGDAVEGRIQSRLEVYFKVML